jgi:hypothetical protein
VEWQNLELYSTSLEAQTLRKVPTFCPRTSRIQTIQDEQVGAKLNRFAGDHRLQRQPTRSRKHPTRYQDEHPGKIQQWSTRKANPDGDRLRDADLTRKRLVLHNGGGSDSVARPGGVEAGGRLDEEGDEELNSAETRGLRSGDW